MSFEKMSDSAEMERFIKDASTEGSLWVPVLQLVYVDKLSRVVSVRQSRNSLLFLPRGTMDPNCTDAKEGVASIALSRAEATFGSSGIVNPEGILVLNYLSFIPKPLNERSRTNWPKADGEAIIPVLAPVDSSSWSALNKNPKLHSVQWLNPTFTLDLLETDVARSNMGSSAVSFTCAESLKLAFPYIPEVAAVA